MLVKNADLFKKINEKKRSFVLLLMTLCCGYAVVQGWHVNSSFASKCGL